MLLRCSTILFAALLCGATSLWAAGDLAPSPTPSSLNHHPVIAVAPTTQPVDTVSPSSDTLASHGPVIAAANASDLAITPTPEPPKNPEAFPKGSSSAIPSPPPFAGEAGRGLAPTTQPAPATQSANDRLPLGPSSSFRSPGTPAPGTPGTPGTSSGKEVKGQTDSSWVSNTFISLAAVVALIFILRSIITKWTGRSASVKASPVVEVLSRVTIAPKNHVLLLRMGNRILVVGDSPAGLRTLANVRDPEEIALLLASISASKPQSISAGFSKLLERLGRDPATAQDDGSVQVQDLGGDQSEHQVDRTRDQVSGLLSRVRSVGKNRPGGVA